MKTLTIGKRIALGSGFLCLVIAGLNWFAYTQLTSLHKVTQSITEDSLPGTILASAINANIADAQLLILRSLLTKTPEERRAIKEGLSQIGVTVTEDLKKYEGTITAEADRRLFEEGRP